MYNTILLVDISPYFYLISFQREFSNRKKQWCQGRTQWSSVFSYDTTSTNHCGRTYFWWVRTRDPHLWFVQPPNWHVPLSLPLSFCAHFYPLAPQLQHHLHGRLFLKLSTPYIHLIKKMLLWILWKKLIEKETQHQKLYHIWWTKEMSVSS